MASRSSQGDRSGERAASLYRDLFELSRDGIYLCRADGAIEAVNRRAVEQTGYPEEELLAGTVLDLHPEEAREEAGEAVREVTREGFGRYELPFERPDGEIWIGEISASRVETEGEVRFQAVVRDVTDRIRTRKALLRARDRLEGIFEIAPVAFSVQDPDTHEFLQVNRAFLELFGFDREEEVLGGPEPVSELWEDPDQRSRINERVARGETVRNEEAAFRTRDGDLFHTLFSLTERTVDDERWRIGAAQDITPRVRVQRQLEHRALHDHLTGLPNRALFWDRLEHALARAGRTDERLAVLFLDLDGFKRINDAHGHAAGDEALQRIAGRLSEVVRAQDTLARLGGDEFGVLLESLSAREEALDVARRVVEEPSTRVEVDGRTTELALSCGVAFAGGGDAPGEDLTAAADDVVRRADRAMYAAKEEAGSAFRAEDAPPAGS